MRTIDLGEISLNGSIAITDPCYEPGTWCSGELQMLPGTYKCKAIEKMCGLWGKRICELTIQHIDYLKVKPTEECAFEVGVDSGQAGFFDTLYYQAHFSSDEWYKRVCNITLNGDECGTIDGVGVVSSSGYGDGGYSCFVAENESGYIVAARIEFIPTEATFQVGDKVKWYDPGINDYPIEEREAILSRVFTIVRCNGEIAYISELDASGNLVGSEAEVFVEDLEALHYL